MKIPLTFPIPYLPMTRSFIYLFIAVLSLQCGPSKIQSFETADPGIRTLSNDGAWCWFSDPRAVYYNGTYRRTYTGWVDSEGNIRVGYYDHDSGAFKHHLLMEEFDKDDHANPALIFDKDGMLMVFYARHSEKEGIHLSKSKSAEEIDEWEEVRIVGKNGLEITEPFGDRYTYANVIYLSEEDRYYLFWRSSDGKPTYSVSQDGGGTWTPGKVFIMPEPTYKFRRPYVKVTSNDRDKIGFAFTDGHPRNEENNSIYYMYLKSGNFYKNDGSMIRSLGEEPIIPEEADKVYDATNEGAKAWIWDLAFDEEERPVLAYVRFPTDEDHVYCIGRWNESHWENSILINSGSWFPGTPKDQIEPEPNYSGGLSIDQEDTNTIYLSVHRKGVFEIEKWQSNDGGKTWQSSAVTKHSTQNNIRPFAVRNASEGNPLQVLWMSNRRYEHYTKYDSEIQMFVEE